MPIVVAILDSMWPGMYAHLSELGFAPTTDDKNADVIIVRSGHDITRKYLESHEKIRVVLRAGSGMDNIDLAACRDRGVYVTNFPGINAHSVAEVAVGFMLVMSHRLIDGSRQMARNSADKSRLWGSSLTTRSIGIVGFGSTGQATARLLRSIGITNLTACRGSGLNPVPLNICPISSFEECLKSDIVSLHVPLTSLTHHLINATSLERISAGTLLINLARRDVVEHKSVRTCLESGRLSGYASDVLDPIQDRDLLELDNVFATPHLGAQAMDLHETMARAVVDWLICWRTNESI